MQSSNIFDVACQHKCLTPDIREQPHKMLKYSNDSAVLFIKFIKIHYIQMTNRFIDIQLVAFIANDRIHRKCPPQICKARLSNAFVE